MLFSQLNTHKKLMEKPNKDYAGLFSMETLFSNQSIPAFVVPVLLVYSDGHYGEWPMD